MSKGVLLVDRYALTSPHLVGQQQGMQLAAQLFFIDKESTPVGYCVN
ncbi:MAG: hypothetical protein V3W06_03460 [Acidimicrobiia bacterium]